MLENAPTKSSKNETKCLKIFKKTLVIIVLEESRLITIFVAPDIMYQSKHDLDVENMKLQNKKM